MAIQHVIMAKKNLITRKEVGGNILRKEQIGCGGVAAAIDAIIKLIVNFVLKCGRLLSQTRLAFTRVSVCVQRRSAAQCRSCCRAIMWMARVKKSMSIVTFANSWGSWRCYDVVCQRVAKVVRWVISQLASLGGGGDPPLRGFSSRLQPTIVSGRLCRLVPSRCRGRRG